MRIARAFVTFLLVALACACGPGAKDAAPPPKLDVPKIAAAPAKRSASDDLQRHWPFEGQLRFGVYADAGAMMRMDLFRALADLPGEKCLASVLSPMREVAAGADQRGFVLLARFSPAVPEDELRHCLELLAGHDKELAIDGNLALFGDHALVEAARRGGGAWPAALTVGGDQVVSWTARIGEGEARGGVHVSKERFRADASADVPEELAQLVEDRLGRAEALGPLARALTVARDGRHIDVTFELREPPIEQARDLGILAALATHGVRAYLTRAKTAEAKNVLGSIARAYVAAWEAMPPRQRAQQALPSYPPVPKFVPKGTTHSPTDRDWAAWRPLHFTIEQPHRYQYEIVASKDGQSASILARGDLDGDGKASLFRIVVTLDRKSDSLSVAETIAEVDPDE